MQTNVHDRTTGGTKTQMNIRWSHML